MQNCASCSASLIGRYCHACGEKRLEEQDRKFTHLLGGLVEATLNLDGKLWKSVRGLFRPGRLTAEYWRGRRAPYMKPLSLFLLANALYFLLTQSTMSAIPFASFLVWPWNTKLLELRLDIPDEKSGEFQRAVDAYLRKDSPALAATETGRALDQFAQRYTTDARERSKSLLILLIAIYTPMLALVQRRRREFSLTAHLVFATHFLAAYLLIFLLFEWFYRIGGETVGRFVESGDGWGLPILVTASAYQYFGLVRFYGERRVVAALKAAVLFFGLVATHAIYQQLLFLTSLL